MDMELISKTKGVYCADVKLKAIPISMNSKLPKVFKTLENIPIALDDNLKVINEYFIKRVIKRENLCKYKVNYEIIIKKYLSGICYDVNK
jgi:hypothetical protein